MLVSTWRYEIAASFSGTQLNKLEYKVLNRKHVDGIFQKRYRMSVLFVECAATNRNLKDWTQWWHCWNILTDTTANQEVAVVVEVETPNIAHEIFHPVHHATLYEICKYEEIWLNMKSQFKVKHWKRSNLYCQMIYETATIEFFLCLARRRCVSLCKFIL